MIERVQYDSENKRETLIAEAAGRGLRLAEDARLVDGNFLTFVDEPYPPPPIDWKAKWLGATTAADKLKVLAQRLGLE